jgi:uncharacterized protein YndB with AHSA1/START domain
MKTHTLEIKVERTLPTTAAEAFDAWLNPRVPGTPWNIAAKLILNPVVDGLFYLNVGHEVPHYGRFTEINRPARIQHTWMSPNTHGQESLVTVTFENKGDGTLMRLVHEGIPDSEEGRGHEDGWNYFLDGFAKQLSSTESGTQKR